MLSFTLAKSPTTHPFGSLTPLPIFAPSPTIAPLRMAPSAIWASAKMTELEICTFEPTLTFLPRIAYGPMTEFSPTKTPVSKATGLFT